MVKDMKCTVAVFTALLALAGCAAPAASPGDNPDGSMTVTINADQVAACRANGGCVIVTTTALQELVQAAKNSGATCGHSGVVL